MTKEIIIRVEYPYDDFAPDDENIDSNDLVELIESIMSKKDKDIEVAEIIHVDNFTTKESNARMKLVKTAVDHFASLLWNKEATYTEKLFLIKMVTLFNGMLKSIISNDGKVFF